MLGACVFWDLCAAKHNPCWSIARSHRLVLVLLRLVLVLVL